MTLLVKEMRVNQRFKPCAVSKIRKRIDEYSKINRASSSVLKHDPLSERNEG